MERFRRWRRGRPFWGASLTILAGLELFLSARLDIAVGGMVLQLGVPGLQTTIIPVVMVLAGALAMVQPVHHVFYGVITLALSVYSLVAVNLGGLGVGAVAGIVGSIVVVSWLERADAEAPPAPAAAPPPEDGDPFLLFDDGPQPDPSLRRSTAAALSVVLVAGGLAGGVPGEGPCLLGFILCDVPTTASPSPSASPSGSAAPESTPTPSPSDVGGVGDAIGDAVGAWSAASGTRSATRSAASAT
ncbi:DUF6114 domain-containing protein [Xylanimonas protaetiae]|uniref:Uncharacterized protein n=1 Tax=Xylanimonas protaetiae TaxID=2509457 RepID=A0A4P6F6I1_9MICO|nr:DUF6114 domain-containing protein [Xylanimonas protaetiae]QAY69929.1 hypothetical protein ET471_07710 [Xylanimonas protaetiae]